MSTGSDQRDCVQARQLLARYMELCDVPAHDFSLDELGGLFTDDAVWEGIGEAYTGKFGRVEGRTAIVEMLTRYLPPSTHFLANAHILGEAITRVDSGAVNLRCLMQQLSQYEDGRSEILAARLQVACRQDEGRMRIAHFTTERVFGSPLTDR